MGVLKLPDTVVGTYSPPFALHVKGGWEAREADSIGQPAPQKIFAYCENCKADWQTTCTTGNVKSWIHKFALTHLHRDPFKEPHGMPGTSSNAGRK